MHNKHEKLVHPSRSQSYSTFNPPIESVLRNGFFSCFVPEYLGLQFLRKILFNKLCVFVLSLNFRFFYPNYEPLILKYIKVHIEAFPQSCRYGKYLCLVTVLGMNNLCVRARFFFTSAPKVLSLSRKDNWPFVEAE